MQTVNSTAINGLVVADEYLTTPEAAAYLKLSRQFLEGARYRADGSGPAFIKLKRAVRYRRTTLDTWMSAHDHAPDRPL
jgi:predicted DNA-binding transcriptional regulator AlpA